MLRLATLPHSPRIVTHTHTPPPRYVWYVPPPGVHRRHPLLALSRCEVLTLGDGERPVYSPTPTGMVVTIFVSSP